MKALLSACKHGQIRTALWYWTRALLSLCMVGLPLESALALGYARGEQGVPGREMSGPLRERPSDECGLEWEAEPEEQAQAVQWHARLAWLATLWQASDAHDWAVAPLGSHHVAMPRAPIEVYKHGRIIDPSLYLHHTRR